MLVRLAELAPLLRSTTLDGILRVVLLERGPWTAEELAAQTGAAYQTVTKEVRRLEQAGVLRVTTNGRQKLLEPERSDPVVVALTRLLRLEAGGGDPMAKKKKDKDKDKKKKK